MKALGFHYDHETGVIDRLCRFLAESGADDLTPALFEQWCATQQEMHPSTSRSQRRIVLKLCLYRRRSELDCFIPDASRFPKRRPLRVPVIVDPSDIDRMLQITERRRSHSTVPLQVPMLRLAVVLLYTAGLRHGELLRLQLGDIDVKNGTAMIRESKFYKSRVVPLSSDAQRELQTYLTQRLAKPWNVSSDAPLIGGHRHSKIIHEYSAHATGEAIRKLCIAAGVGEAHGRLPRVQDFRHSFAVQALLRWYRNGADVQSCLPMLSIYMGHVSIASTMYYLHWLPEIAGIASRQFENKFGHLVDGVSS
jgi:integrase